MSLAALIPQTRVVATPRGKITLYPLSLDGLTLLAVNHRQAFTHLFNLFGQVSGGKDLDLSQVLDSFPEFVAHLIAAATLDRDGYQSTSEYTVAVNEEAKYARKLAPGNQLSALYIVFEMLELDLLELGKLMESLSRNAESLATQVTALANQARDSPSTSGKKTSSPPVRPL